MNQIIMKIKENLFEMLIERFMGTMTAREALYSSRNVPAVSTYDEVGHGKANDFAANLGIAIKDEYPSNALGGTTEEFSTLELAGAYAAFGNDGIYTKPHAVTKVVFRDGNRKEFNTKNNRSYERFNCLYGD